MRYFDWHNQPFGWGFPLLGFIFNFFFWLTIFFLVYTLIKNLNNNNSRFEKDNNQSTLGILKERYAKGEIDKKQFEEMKKDLN